MSRRSDRQFISRQLAGLERLHGLAADHPQMGPMFAQRIEQLRSEREQLGAITTPEPRTVFFFAGEPVAGSRAIDAAFVTQLLPPFLEMVKTQYAVDKHGSVKDFGPRKDQDEARLLIAGTPRGSFGIELAPPHTDDLFAEGRMADVLALLTRALQATGESDEAYLQNMETITPRALSRFPEFFRVLKDQGASLRIETGDIECALPRDGIERALERVTTLRTTEREVVRQGRFHGALLDSWRFDFLADEGELVSGRIGPDVTEDEVIAMQALFGKPAEAVLQEITTTTKNGLTRRRYVLLGLAPR